MSYHPVTPEHLRSADLISCHLSRKTIESGALDRIFDRLQLLVTDTELVRRHQNKLRIFISGYDADPRQFWEIEAVRQAISGLDKRFPAWLHFCEKQIDFLRLMFWCLTPMQMISPNLSVFEVDSDTIIEILNERVKAAHRLQIENGFSQLERDIFAEQVFDKTIELLRQNSYIPRNNG